MGAVAFIGLGNMGLPMALNLQRGGHKVTAFDLSPAAIEAARKGGLAVATSGTEAAKGADAVVTMLPTGKHVISAYQDGGLLAAAPKGALFIDCTTADVADARKAHELAKAAGMDSADAPVSGGTFGAEAGTLTFMAGGTAAAIERARPYLEKMGARIVHCGDAGAGQAAKICNNMIMGVTMIAVCEGFVLGEKLGLSHQTLFDVASTSSASCFALTKSCPVPGPVPGSAANNDYKPGFATSLMLKDLKLAEAAGVATHTDNVLARHAAALFQRFADNGGAGMDFTAIVNEIRARSA